MNRLAIDVDGVLADFKTSFDMSRHNTNSQTRGIFWKNSPYDFWVGLESMIDYKLFKDIVKDREIIFLTNCPNATARRDWLKKKKFWTDKSCLWCNAPGESKLNALKMIMPDLFIDDYEKNWKECAKANVPIFQFDAEAPLESWQAINLLINGEQK